MKIVNAVINPESVEKLLVSRQFTELITEITCLNTDRTLADRLQSYEEHLPKPQS